MPYEDVNVENIGKALDELNESGSDESSPVTFSQCGQMLLIGTGHATNDRRNVDKCILDKDASTVCGGRFTVAYANDRKRVLINVRITAGAFFKRRPDGEPSFEFKSALMEALLDAGNVERLDLKTNAKKALKKKIADQSVDAGDVDWTCKAVVK
jgi:hypothetical protein